MSIQDTFTYTWFDGSAEIIWNITLARVLVADYPPSALVEIPATDLRGIVARHQPDPARFDAVDPTHPGIAAPILDGWQVMWVLIDGNHRGARCLRDGLPFQVYPLTIEDNRACVLMSTAGVIP
jgi:hypothetical protein